MNFFSVLKFFQNSLLSKLFFIQTQLFLLFELRENVQLKNYKYSPEIREPFHQLCCVIFIEFNIGKIHFQHRRAGITHPEEHQFGLSQMHRR